MENNIRKIEDCILTVGQLSTDLVFDKFQSGDISAEELQSIYRELSQWSNCCQHLLNILQGNEIVSVNEIKY